MGGHPKLYGLLLQCFLPELFGLIYSMLTLTLSFISLCHFDVVYVALLTI